jgi:hypothetical protein
MPIGALIRSTVLAVTLVLVWPLVIEQTLASLLTKAVSRHSIHDESPFARTERLTIHFVRTPSALPRGEGPVDRESDALAPWISDSGRGWSVDSTCLTHPGWKRQFGPMRSISVRPR